MNLLRCSRVVVGALLAAFLGGCGGSSNQNAPAVVTTFYATSAVFKNHSTMYMSGYNAFGQLGTGNLENQSGFKAPAGIGLRKVDGFSVGGAHTLAFQNMSSVQSWGSNGFGQLGANVSSGSSQVSKNPVPVLKSTGAVLSHVTAVSAGGYHSLAVSDGNVYAWGTNGSGQLGLGDARNFGYTDQNRANYVVKSDESILSGISQVAAGGTCSFALTSDGNTLYAWGNNANGQLGPQIPIAAAVNKATAVVLSGVQLPIKQIAAAGSYIVLVDDNNAVWAWGYDYWGQIGVDPTTLGTDSSNNARQYVTTPTQIMKPDGTALYATKVAAGSDHVLALELTPPGTPAGVWAWGQDFFGQLGSNNKSVGSMQHGGADGTTLYYSFKPVQVLYNGTDAGNGSGTALTGVVDIYAYGNSSFAVLGPNAPSAEGPNGTLYAWGSNVYGQLGFSDNTKLGYQEVAVQVPAF